MFHGTGYLVIFNDYAGVRLLDNQMYETKAEAKESIRKFVKDEIKGFPTQLKKSLMKELDGKLKELNDTWGDRLLDINLGNGYDYPCSFCLDSASVPEEEVKFGGDFDSYFEEYMDNLDIDRKKINHYDPIVFVLNFILGDEEIEGVGFENFGYMGIPLQPFPINIKQLLSTGKTTLLDKDGNEAVLAFHVDKIETETSVDYLGKHRDMSMLMSDYEGMTKAAIWSATTEFIGSTLTEQLCQIITEKLEEDNPE